jgi:hypothetical protein
MADKPFTIRASGRLVSPELWEIDAQLRAADGEEPARGDVELGKARLSLFQAVLTEAARGRQQGATTVRVRMNDLGETYEADLAELLDDTDTWH